MNVNKLIADFVSCYIQQPVITSSSAIFVGVFCDFSQTHSKYAAYLFCAFLAMKTALPLLCADELITTLAPEKVALNCCNFT